MKKISNLFLPDADRMYRFQNNSNNNNNSSMSLGSDKQKIKWLF